MFKKKIKRFIPGFLFDALRSYIEKNTMLLGNQLSRVVKTSNYTNLQDAEFCVFSQFGEDGIIQYLVRKIDIPNKYFIEFGVESYEESNTRFLLTQDNWSGLIIDGATAHIDFLNRSGLSWRHSINAVSKFITKDNINEIFRDANVAGDIGLLSVDLDGNDYWVLNAISDLSPRILVAEYNSLWGAEAVVTIPYDASFYRTKAHYSNLYWGASLAAITKAASNKNMSLVACNKAGNNAFFVRNDLLGEMSVLTPAQAYVECKYRESRDKNGKLTFLDTRAEKLNIISEMPIWDISASKLKTVGDIFKH